MSEQKQSKKERELRVKVASQSDELVAARAKIEELELECMQLLEAAEKDAATIKRFTAKFARMSKFRSDFA